MIIVDFYFHESNTCFTIRLIIFGKQKNLKNMENKFSRLHIYD